MQHGTIGRVVFATLLMALGTPPRATAFDLSGDYVGSSNGGSITLTLVQTGTGLHGMGRFVFGGTTYVISSTGTVDPSTG